MIATTLKLGSHHLGPAICLPVLLLSLGCPRASAQCSQETRPEAAPAQSIDSTQNATPPPTQSGESSSAASTIRFVTGSAITVLEDTPLQVVNDMPISSRTTQAGARLAFTVTSDVVVDGVLVIPCGATVYGTVVQAKQAGRLVGASSLTLQWTSLSLDGRSYPLYTAPFKVVGASKTAPTVKKASIGAGMGVLAGEASMPPPRTITLLDGSPHPHQEIEKITPAQRVAGDAIFAGMGAGAGLAIAASTPPSIALIPAESQMEFTLASPIAVFPVDQHTAARLAQGLHHGGPVLYMRGENQ